MYIKRKLEDNILAFILSDNHLVAVEVKNKVKDKQLPLKDKNYRAFSRLHGDINYYVVYREIANDVNMKNDNILPVYFL